MMLGGRAAHCMVVAFTLAGLFSGCAGLPTGRFDALAAASKAVDTNTVEADSDIVKLTRHYMIFSPAPGPYKIDSFAPVIEVQGQKRDFDFGPRLEPRDAALDVLASYTDALAAYKDAVGAQGGGSGGAPGTRAL